jgi:hypothetical protein
MTRADLNLSFLRSEAARPPGDESGPFRLSRRQLLGAGGSLALAAAGMSTLLQAAGQATMGPVTVAGDSRRIALQVGGTERWVIEARRFGGTPRLSLTEQDGATRITLTGARYPGTALPADLAAELRQVRSVWRLRLRLAAGGFAADVPLADWLSGNALARSRVRLNDLAAALGAAGALRLAGTGEATFTPEWELHLAGPGIARLATDQVNLTADTATLTLLSPDAPSLLQHAAGRRTLITLQRQGQAWENWPGLAALDAGRVLAGPSPFDQIRIETQETQSGEFKQALVAEAASEKTGALAYRPGAELVQADGSPARLDLRGARYALAFGPEGDQAALVARFAQEPTWVHSRGLTLHLGDAPNARPFELVARGGEVTRRNVAPAIFSMAAAMPGAIVEPIQTTGAAPIEIVSMHGMPVVAADSEVAATGDLTPIPSPIPIPFPVINPPIQIMAPASYISVLRPADMLSFEVKFLNLRLTSRQDGPPYLSRTVPQRDGYVLFRFPPQHIAEEVYQDPGETPKAPPIPHRAAGPSWVAFKLPTTMDTLDYTLASLLDWNALIPVNESSRRNATVIDTLSEPFTAIEAPYRLFLSPTDSMRWRHKADPITLDNRTELWHTRLGPGSARVGPGAVKPGVRAIWTPDWPAPGAAPPSAEYPPLKPFRYSMNARDRYEIVAQSPAPARGFASDPIRVENLMLTSQGAWMKVEGHWNPGDSLSVTAWRHEATMGRDQFVKVVQKGYLYPFGHKALLVTETQRRVETVPGTTRRAAYLRQRQYIVVVERDRSYPGPADGGVTSRIKRNRNMPLRTVTMLTGTTPNLDPSDNATYQVPTLGQTAFWPRFNGDYFNFHMVGEDWEGQRIEYTAPLIWCSNVAVTGDTKLAKMALVKNEYDKLADRRTADMKGQRIAYAPRVPVPNHDPADPNDPAGDTVLETASLSFSSVPIDADETLVPPFLPQMDTAAIRVGSLTQMTGSAAPKSIRMDDKWLEQGFGALNPGMVFAAFDGMPNISFGGDKTGAVLTPDMPLAGLSLSHGLVGGDNDKFGAGQFDPASFFKDKGKILGGIVLAEIIDIVNDVTATQDKTKVPRITSQLHYPGGDTNQAPDAMNTDLVWEPKLKDAGPFISYYNADPDANEKGKPGTKDASLTLTAHLHTPLKSGATPTYHVHGELNNFTADLFDCIVLGFDHLHFTADSGKDPKTDIGLTWVRFTGALEFVQKLRDALGDIFGDGFKLDVEPIGIRASFTVALPKIALGVFSLTNMSLSAGLDLPFTGKPALVNFAFCSRENPFCLTVSMFGGGGFFGITLGLSGVEILEVALEFGASVSIDLGVASGGVSVKAGIYFKYVKSPPDGPGSLLEGYVKIHGEMTVMLIASLSITLYLSLTYKTPNKCWGQATLTVEVEVLFISFSVDVHCERQFSGDDHDPSFSQMITAGQWTNYTEAFA